MDAPILRLEIEGYLGDVLGELSKEVAVFPDDEIFYNAIREVQESWRAFSEDDLYGMGYISIDGLEKLCRFLPIFCFPASENKFKNVRLCLYGSNKAGCVRSETKIGMKSILNEIRLFSDAFQGRLADAARETVEKLSAALEGEK